MSGNASALPRVIHSECDHVEQEQEQGEEQQKRIFMIVWYILVCVFSDGFFEHECFLHDRVCCFHREQRACRTCLVRIPAVNVTNSHVWAEGRVCTSAILS